MFVRLGRTYDMHRAYVVRGVLEAHGVPAEVWHEVSLLNFLPGWQGCDVVVHPDEFEAAVEVLHARPEEIPEQEGAGEITAPFRKHPTFLDCLIVGAGIAIFLGFAYALALVPEHLERGSSHASLLDARDVMEFLVTVPVGSLFFAVFLTACLAPLRIWEGHRWMGMSAIVFPWCFLLFVATVAQAIGTAVSGSR